MSRDDSSSFTQLCGLLCLHSSNKEDLSTRTWSNVRKATPETSHKEETTLKTNGEENVVITEPLLSSSTDNSKRPPTHNSNQPSSNGSLIQGLKGFYSRSRRPSFGELKESTVLCCSPIPPRPGQVDLCPPVWFCSEYPEDSSFANQSSDPQLVEKHVDSCCQLQISDILWRALFFMTCFPLCYLCYFSRNMRRRRRITRPEYFLSNDQRTRNCQNHSRNTHSQVVVEGQDMMGVTMLRQMEQIKLTLNRTVNTSGLKPGEPDSLEEGVMEGTEDAMRIPNDPPRPVEEDASPSKVIKVNVIVLHSASSFLIYEKLVSTLADTPNSPSPQGTQSDGMPRIHTAPAKVSGTNSFLEVPGAKSSSVKRLASLPSSSSTRQQDRLGQSLCFDVQGSRPTESLVPANHHDGVISVHISSQEKLSTVVENEDIDKDSSLIPGTTEPFTRRSSSSTSEVFYDCPDTISSLPTGLPEDGGQRPAIIISSSQNEEEVLMSGANAPVITKEHKKGNWGKIRSLCFMGGFNRGQNGTIPEDKETVPDGSSDPTEHLGRRISTNLSERTPSSEMVGASRNHVEHDDVQLRSGEKKLRSNSKSKSRSYSRSWFGQRSHVKKDSNGRKSSSKNGPHIKDGLVKMESLGNRTELIKDLGFQLSFSIFNEASVSRWKGRDLQEAIDIPNMDLFLLTVRQNNLSELTEVLNTESGMISYLAKFWTGFYPLLLIEILNKNIDNAEESEPFSRQLQRIHAYFGDVHHIRIYEDELEDHMDWIGECIGRLYINARLYQCSRFYGDCLSSLDRCPGGCELKKNRTKPSRRLTRKPALLKKHSRSAYERTKVIPEAATERS